jgi:Zn-dependent peptidase ImmA (M78 family)
MKRPRNKFIGKIITVADESDPMRAVELFVEGHRRPGDTLESIAYRLGVRDIVEEKLPFEGGIFYDLGRMKIKINSLSPRVRQRFTLAHEIGHLLLAEMLKGKTDCTRGKELEQACDAIAAELLMPAIETTSYNSQLGPPSPQALRELSRKFDVSLYAAALRVHSDLKLWPQSIGLWEFKGKREEPGATTGSYVDSYPEEVWFVGRRRWSTKWPPFRAFHQALSSSEPVRCRESYFEDNTMKPIALEVLHVGYQRLLGIVE